MREKSAVRLWAMTSWALWYHAAFQPLVAVVLPREVKAAMVDGGAAAVLGQALVLVKLIDLIGLGVSHLSDRSNTECGRRRPFLLAGTALSFAGFAMLIVSHNSKSMALLLSSFAIIFLGLTVVSSAGNAIVPEFVPRNQSGLASTMQSLNRIAGSIVGFGMLSFNLPISVPIVCLMALSAVFTLLACFACNEDIRDHDRDHDGDGSRSGVSRKCVSSLGISVRTNPDFVLFLLARVFAVAGLGAMGFLQYWLTDCVGLSESDAQREFSRSAILVMLGHLSAAPFGKISDSFLGKKSLLIVGISSSSALLLVLVFVFDVWVLAPFSYLSGFCHGLVNVIETSVAYHVIPSSKNAAKGMSVITVAVIIGFFIGQVLMTGILSGYTIKGTNNYLPSGYQMIFGMAFAIRLVSVVFIGQLNLNRAAEAQVKRDGKGKV